MPFDIGFIELCVIMVLTLVLLGPDKLPVAARTLTRWFGASKRMVNRFSAEVDRELQIDELKRALQQQEQRLDKVTKPHKNKVDTAAVFNSGESASRNEPS